MGEAVHITPVPTNDRTALAVRVKRVGTDTAPTTVRTEAALTLNTDGKTLTPPAVVSTVSEPSRKTVFDAPKSTLSILRPDTRVFSANDTFADPASVPLSVAPFVTLM